MKGIKAMMEDPLKGRGIIQLPYDIIKKANKENWKYLYDVYLTTDNEYVYKPPVMRKFIEKLLRVSI